jgi:hypothetical protein
MPISRPTPSPMAAPTTPKLSTIRLASIVVRSELLVVDQRRALVRGPVDHEEPAKVPAMGIEDRGLAPFDPAAGLHPPEHLDELAEHLDRALLTTPHRRTEPDEQGSIGHHDSFMSLDDPNLSGRSA